MRDHAGQTRGVGFATFLSADAAVHCLRAIKAGGGKVAIDGAQCRAAFSRGYAAAEASRAAADRASARRNEKRGAEAGEEREPGRQWPPPFTVDAAAYTFDATSGYFFEPVGGPCR